MPATHLGPLLDAAWGPWRWNKGLRVQRVPRAPSQCPSPKSFPQQFPPSCSSFSDHMKGHTTHQDEFGTQKTINKSANSSFQVTKRTKEPEGSPSPGDAPAMAPSPTCTAQ